MWNSNVFTWKDKESLVLKQGDVDILFFEGGGAKVCPLGTPPPVSERFAVSAVFV